jgi:hypothetical protein
MAYTQLRRLIIPNTSGTGAPYVAIVAYYDSVTRKPIELQFDSQVNDPAELTKGQEVDRYDYAAGKTRLVRYDGNGSVYTQNLAGPNPTPGIGTALKLKAMPIAAVTTDSNLKDGVFDLTGQYGVPPYQLEVTGQSGQATGYHQTAVSKVEQYPVRFSGLANGQYFLKVTDATGDFRTQLMNIQVGMRGQPTAAIIQDRIVGDRLLRARWLLNSLNVEYVGLGTENGNQPYQSPVGKLLDAYLLPGSNGTLWRQVYSDGKDNVYFTDTSTELTSTLALDNLIVFNPDTTAEQNGGLIVEVTGGARPLNFSLLGPGGPRQNATGRFDGLSEGEYEYLVTDARGIQISGPLQLTAPYRLWRYLDYDDLDSTPHRLELWQRNFDGEPAALCGQANPVVLRSDGLNGSAGSQGDVPPVVGRSAELNLLVEPDLFEPIVIGDDRLCRCDYYYNGQLEFRGYIKPDIYTAPLLEGLQPTGLTATDGLADLKDTEMLGHIGQRLGGHRPVLQTILHCLSRTSIALPLRIYTNRRDSAMATEDAPEEAATTNRTGYWDEQKNEPENQRTVLDAEAQLLGGTLVQRAGAWEIRSALEAATDAAGRSYLPAGTPTEAVVAVAPAGDIEPPGPSRWHWLEANQQKQVRAGWKYLAGTTDTDWLENAFWPGKVFSDPAAWLTDASHLRGTSGWKVGGGGVFPLVLERVGDKGKDYSTQWPRSIGLRIPDKRWFESPPLPLAPGLEAVPAFISITGKFVPSEYYTDSDGQVMTPPSTAKTATLGYEVYYDGRAAGVTGLATFDIANNGAAKDTTFTAPLPPMPSGTESAVLRLYAWTAPDSGQLDAATPAPANTALTFMPGSLVKSDFGTGKMRLFVARHDYAAQPLTDTTTWAEIEATNASTGRLLLSSVGIQLRPQGATWEGEDNFQAVGPGGNIRPEDPLKVYHADVPISAGLFSGNLYAFGRGVGLLDGTMTTSWSRAIDKEASPLLESNVFDLLALRANPARLATGTLRHVDIPPPHLLDAIDTPYDFPGRRFLVGALTWDTRAASAEVSLVEIGPGADAPDPSLDRPANVRLTHRVYAYAPGKYAHRVRRVHGGGMRTTH